MHEFIRSAGLLRNEISLGTENKSKIKRRLEECIEADIRLEKRGDFKRVSDLDKNGVYRNK